MPVSDEGEGDDRESGGGLFGPVPRKPRKKAANRKRTNTSSPYKTRSQYKKRRIQSEHDTETDKSGTVTETDSDRPESESPAMSENESMHIGSPSRVQLNEERQGSGAGAGALPRKQSGTSVTKQKEKPSSRARVPLNDIKDIPENSRQVILTSNDPNCKLANINPFKVKTEIDNICGTITKLENLQSGSILLHTTSLQQTKTVLKITQFLQIPVTASIAWNRQMTFGKIYLPEFIDESLEDTLSCFRNCGVVEVRRMYNDPKKAHIPLFVFTFLGQAPDKILLGYIPRKVTTFYPSPEKCNNCHRLNHRTNRCRGKATCSYCSSTEHTRVQCTADAPKCINCHGAHESTSRICPKFQYEKDVCKITAEQGIHFAEAREQNEKELIRPITQPTRPDTTSQRQLPPLGLSKSPQS